MRAAVATGRFSADVGFDVLAYFVVGIVEATVAQVANDNVPWVASIGSDGRCGNLDAFMAARAGDIKHNRTFQIEVRNIEHATGRTFATGQESGAYDK